jgi:glycosyltransferase involved in cell wall biosynthesis
MDQRAPAVSVIIIFLNGRRFLAEAIESVLGQSFGDWELLLVDDGSSDGSGEIAQSYAASSPRIRCLAHPGGTNRGMSASRNLGLSHARGRYLAFLDADDIWLPEKLARQVGLMQAQPQAGLSYGRTLYWHSWSPTWDGQPPDYEPRLGAETGRLHPPPRLLAAMLRGDIAAPSLCSVMVERGSAEKVNGFEATFPGLYEDQVFWAKLFLRESVYVHDERLELYRQWSGSATAQVGQSDHIRARLTFLQWLLVYLKSEGCADGDVWRAWRREWWLLSHAADPYLPTALWPAVRRLKKWLLRAQRRLLPGSP